MPTNKDIKTQVEEEVDALLTTFRDYAQGRFGLSREATKSQILSLINEARVELLDDLSKFLDDHQKAPNGGWIDYHYVKNHLTNLKGKKSG